MRQRALIAMAVACRPRLLIADEPTTALDVTVQAQIVKLLNELRRDLGLSVVFISHNLELIGEIVDRVVVMYGGKVVENGGVDAIETKPRHPYTRLLKACVPRIDGPIGPLTAIEGAPPRLGHMPQGCPFAPRCQVNLPVCGETMPPLARDQDRLVACWNPQ
jgi:oligopeptide/dipeptide ABC transporter ATP-binding protein